MPFTRICCVPVEWMNFCIIDEADARDKVTYQKSVEQRNNIRCVWLVRTSNYTNCNWSHTLWKTLIIHEVRLVESQCFQSLREFSWCYIWNCILSSVAISDWICSMQFFCGQWHQFETSKKSSRCCCFHVTD